MRDKGSLSSIPWPIRYFVGLSVYSKISGALYGQGTGRYTPTELTALREEIWVSLNELLGGEMWVLGGEGPTEADASLFGSLAGTMSSPAYVSCSNGDLGYSVLMTLGTRKRKR
jgi:hypothetical protein